MLYRITIPTDEWVSIKDKTPFTSGDRVRFENIGSPVILFKRSDTQPDINDAGKPLYGTQDLSDYSELIVPLNSQDVWCKANQQTGILLVYDANESEAPSIDDEVYTGGQALTNQSFTEANTKNGAQFSSTNMFSGVVNNEVLDTIVLTGDKYIIIKAQSTDIDGDGVVIDWYKDPVYTGGVDVTSGVYNQFPSNAFSTSLQVIGVRSTSAATFDFTVDDTTKPVVTSVGTKIQPTTSIIGTSGQGNRVVATGRTIGLDFILDKNSVYLYRKVSLSTDAQRISGFTTWYEGDLSRVSDNAPYNAPTFTGFSINSFGTNEVGQSTSAGNQTFEWVTENSDNINDDSIVITDVTDDTVLASNVEDTGSEVVNLPSYTNTSSTVHTWKISAINSKGLLFNRLYTIPWLWRVHHGESTELLLDSVGVLALRASELLVDSNKTYSCLDGGYKYIAYPVVFGLKTSFIDNLTDIAIDMVAPTVVSLTNIYGVVQDYYVHRSVSLLLGAVDIRVSV